jgi:hypothetical protein
MGIGLDKLPGKEGGIAKPMPIGRFARGRLSTASKDRIMAKKIGAKKLQR